METEESLVSMAIASIDSIPPLLRTKTLMERIMQCIQMKFQVEGVSFFEEMSFHVNIWKHIVCSFLTIEDLARFFDLLD